MKDIFLVDVDDTVLDFHGVSALALRVAFEENGIEWKEELETSFRAFNGELWAALERKELARDTLMKERFPRFFAYMGMKDVDGARVNDSFIRYISTHPRFLKGAEDFLKELEKMGSIYFVTNGTKEIQKSRFDIIQLWKYAKQTFVSQEVGYDKPAKEYTDYVIAHIPGFDRARAVWIGDSLSADVLAAKNAGITSIWYNPMQKSVGAGDSPDCIANDFSEILSILKKIS